MACSGILCSKKINRSEASQGDYAAFLNKKGLTRALRVQGGSPLQPRQRRALAGC